MRSSNHVLVWVAVLLMVIVGLARAAGGVTLMVTGKTSLPESEASSSTMAMIGLFLVLIGIAEIVAAIGVAMRKRRFWTLGIVATVAFVLDGAINGYLLFGRPGDGGTVVNAVVAAGIIASLLRTRPRASSDVR